MLYQGTLIKMKTEWKEPIQYYMPFQDGFIHLNQTLGMEWSLKFEGFECLSCHQNRPVYRMGFCRQCFFDSASAGAWIINPELSMAHLDKEDRDLDYEKKMQLQPHIVYLANSSNIKVGVTRKAQVPTRWIDQGAHEAIPILETPNRYLAGITEVALKQHVSDKTSWQKMLKNISEEADLGKKRDSLKEFIPEETSQYFLDMEKTYRMQFPVTSYPEKVKSLNLDKSESYSGRLIGVKGQYLIFEDGTVFNVRSHEGYVVSLDLRKSKKPALENQQA